MSSSFIGSKIAIITKTQCRYVGTIIGIDAKTSSILLGTVKCYGTENRPGNFVTSQIAGTVVPVMQFANSDIEDLKIVDEETTVETPKAPAPQPAVPSPAAPVQPSIHDDPAIVSAVMSSSNNDKRSAVPLLPASSRLMTAFEQLTLTDQTSKEAGQEMKSVWDTTSNKTNHSKAIFRPTPQENKSRFFDDFHSNNSNDFAFQPSNRQSSHSNQDRAFRSSNGHSSNGPRAFLNQYHRPMSNQNNQHHRRPGGNRETFQGNVNDIDDEFDFESNNRNFNKIASEDEFKQQTDVQPSQMRSLPMAMSMDNNNSSATEYQPLYDKKKSFFDNTVQMNSHGDSLMGQQRSYNQEAFGNDGFYHQRSKQRNMGNSHRRANHNNYRQQGNEDFYYRQNNNNNNSSNGYSYRY